MNALLYALVVVIWGTTWIAIFLQQGPVAAPVSIFWRFAVASVTMLAILLVTRRLRPLGAKIISAACCRAAASSALISGVYTAAAWINTGLESVIFSMAVLFNAINSFLFPPAAAGPLLGRRRAGSRRYRHPVLGRPAGQRTERLAAVGDRAERPGYLRFFARQYVQYSPPAPRAGNADHQQLGDALRHAGDGGDRSAARR